MMHRLRVVGIRAGPGAFYRLGLQNEAVAVGGEAVAEVEV